MTADEDVAIFLRKWHERLGHPSVDVLQSLYRTGALEGPEITADQFNRVQFFCPVCARTRQHKKPHRKKRRKTRRKYRILEEVVVDVAGPRVARSLRYRGERGN